jgi:hypothetical protein
MLQKLPETERRQALELAVKTITGLHKIVLEDAHKDLSQMAKDNYQMAQNMNRLTKVLLYYAGRAVKQKKGSSVREDLCDERFLFVQALFAGTSINPWKATRKEWERVFDQINDPDRGKESLLYKNKHTKKRISVYQLRRDYLERLRGIDNSPAN